MRSIRTLTDDLVTRIRTEGRPDTYWERLLRLSTQTIRNARIGETYRHVPTPPDTKPRVKTGNWGVL
jgi:hypothetical protein